MNLASDPFQVPEADSCADSFQCQVVHLNVVVQEFIFFFKFKSLHFGSDSGFSLQINEGGNSVQLFVLGSETFLTVRLNGSVCWESM